MKNNTMYIDVKKTYGEKFTLVGISENFEFKNNKRTDKKIGYKFEIVLPLRGFEKLNVRIDDPNYNVADLMNKLEKSENPFFDVQFSELSGIAYNFNNKLGCSLRATACKAV